jgi:hypothetical protein
LSSCTENGRARAWGGEMTVNVKPDQKVVNVTWKESDMWVLTRPMNESDKPETLTFSEKSTFGVWEGSITLIESRANKSVSHNIVSPNPASVDIPTMVIPTK